MPAFDAPKPSSVAKSFSGHGTTNNRKANDLRKLGTSLSASHFQGPTKGTSKIDRRAVNAALSSLRGVKLGTEE